MTAELRRWFAFSVVVLVVVIALRAPILERSVIDWDESVYLLVSSSMLDGHLPYLEVWDHKQPFLYVLVSLGFLLPDPIVGVRLLGCVAIAVTAVLLAFLVQRGSRGLIAPLAAAAFYILATMAPGGLATNTEILFAPLVAATCALLVAAAGDHRLESRIDLAWWCLAGFLSGLAVLVKLSAAFEIIALAAAGGASWWMGQRGRTGSARRLSARFALFCLAALVPVVLTVSVYWFNGVLDEFLFANLGFNLSYTRLDLEKGTLLAAALSRQAIRGNLVLLVVALLGTPWVLLSAHERSPTLFRVAVIGTAWLTGASISVLAVGKLYDHHLLQMVPPAVLLSAVIFAMLLRAPRRPLRTIAVVVLSAVVVLLAWHARDNLGPTSRAPDVPRAVGDVLLDRVADGDTIYVANSQPVIYLLADADPPSRYVLPVWVIRPEFRRRLGLELDGFLDGVFEQGPTYVVMETDNPWLPDGPFVEHLVDQYLRGRYEPVARIGSTMVFRRAETGRYRSDG